MRPACAVWSARSARSCATPPCASRKAAPRMSGSRAADIQAILGAPRFENEVAMRTSVPGVATGLAWTRAGGDILFIEATRSAGDGRLILTGQLGDVMRESAQAALSLVKNRAAAHRHRSGAVREDRHPHPSSGGRDPEGRAERGRRAVLVAGVAADRPQCAQRHGDDRRDIPCAAWCCRSAASRRRPRRRCARGSSAWCCRRGTGRTSRTSRTMWSPRLEFIWAGEVGEVLDAVLEEKPSVEVASAEPHQNSVH